MSFPATRGRLSGIGVAVGYVGTLLTAVILLLLGITESPDPIFPIAGVLFAIFAVPIFLVVREPTPPPGSERVTWADLRGSFAPGRGDDPPRPAGAGPAPVPGRAGCSTRTR